MIDRVIKLNLCLFVLLMVAACAHLSTSSKSEDALKQRVHTEWEAKVKKDWGTVYDLSVAEFKNKVDRNTFIQKANVDVEAFSIKEVKILEPGRKAKAIVNYKITHMQFKFNMTANEEWLCEDGAWHLNLTPIMGLPFMNTK